MGASLLRLHFHDCFVNASTFHSLCLHCHVLVYIHHSCSIYVSIMKASNRQGCDASVLLDGSSGEKSAGPNANSIRGFEVIDNIKSQVEKLCPGVVSCADILTVSARDATVALGGPSWSVPLGRRDSTTASASAANSNLPGPASSLSALITAFSNKGFTAKEMVALSGSHTIGQARCTVFRSRIYNETNIDSQFATSVQSKCPSAGGDNNLSPLDVTSPTSFDNAYFKNLQSQKGLLHSDQELFNGGSTDAQVNAYSTNSASFFTDFANAMGCDASVLLDGSTGEKSAGPNANSIRGFDVIDTIKSQVENLCPGVVSCADILTVAARDATVALGGPSWSVPLGRRDSTTASASAANSNLPGPAFSLSALITAFSNKGFTANEMVALSGSHTIGQSRCTVFRSRVYNETNIDSQFATSVQSNCPSTGGDNNLSPLDLNSPTSFDNTYFKNLQSQKGLLHSDQELFNGGSTDNQVNAYSINNAAFFADFANAMVKMGNLSPLTGTSGQIRTNCRKTN
ncbi:hypothetical protein RHSIM_Rhsim05G0228600 [Rhododendron simsii]|uniref:peroxidase n=1 Tax=Rhododendron simsii TaxID=118357 RepID=A0A834GY80_RHOSS|nr:hypothetical protein RHSIM_Rhsim05G0228600 [Rhododendron simsii]